MAQLMLHTQGPEFDPQNHQKNKKKRKKENEKLCPHKKIYFDIH